jgi:hypothetical protein
MTNSAYAKNKGDVLLCSILCCNCVTLTSCQTGCHAIFSQKKNDFSAPRMLILLGV